ncbi:formylglycine-generating enzyme required for sulfatase activity [Salinibacter ruber]|uniref:formylglycine-generating enzyme family protein n=2 Tax=Salinibacter ruber TaxID=146919 RepID=UPI0021695BDD|nr:formylglycine-generating enzyme family protein [Salinibacter ruber]MCS3651948.1 formylglycine-generating enzyme required for sulfatase activity [Salinibacter ruber]MCS3655063.1 formylglycine-generating enzyme required for sulfatase activity [Salinibacter ruber]
MLCFVSPQAPAMARTLLVGILLGLVGLPMAHAQEVPADNRYRTGDTYLQVETVQTDRDGRTATLDVRWDASWHDAENWDAAWIVLKGRRPGGPLVPLRVRGAPAMADNRSPDGAEAAFDVPDDRVGFFAYRAGQGEGTNHWRLRVSWTAANGVDAGSIEGVAALGVEMVRVPTGEFELGTTRSLTGRRESTSRDWLGGTPPAPLSALFRVGPDGEDLYGGSYPVTSEAPISIGTDAGDLYYIDAEFLEDFSSGDQQGTLSAAFPKGYQGFYQMKYEVTEQQYVDFLSGLSPEQARQRWTTDPGEAGGPPPSRYRHTIVLEDGRYRTVRPHRAAGYLSWQDALAWADWMGLRPMTGLEFEKSARGPKPARFREFVWGVREVGASDHFVLDRRILDPGGSLAATEDGDERVDGNVHVQLRPTFEGADNYCTPGGNYFPYRTACRELEGGDGGWGPLRVGIHGVGSGGVRVAAGAGYYGAMDLGGNLLEQVVTLGHPQGRAFRGTHGDGRLGPQVRATNPDWHADADTSAYATRGAGWPSHPNHARTADRFSGLRRGGTRRSPAAGFRAVRTLP